MAVSQGPSLELQTALVAVWRASADLKTLIGDPIRLYQDVPDSPVFPYVTIGEGQDVPDLAECIDGSEVYSDLHIWTKESGFTTCKKIVATMWAAASAASITLTENRLILVERNGERYLRDPSDPIKHGVLTLRALTDPA